MLGFRIFFRETQSADTLDAPAYHCGGPSCAEIMEQPESLSRALNYGGRFRDMSSVKLGGLDQNMESLSVIENLVICGCGTVCPSLPPP